MRYFESLSWPLSILVSIGVQDKAMFIVKCEIQRQLNIQKPGDVLSLVEVGKVEEKQSAMPEFSKVCSAQIVSAQQILEIACKCSLVNPFNKWI